MISRGRFAFDASAVAVAALGALLFGSSAATAAEFAPQNGQAAHAASTQDSEPCQPDDDYDGGIGIPVLDKALEDLLGGFLGDDNNDCELNPGS
ncbi:MAG: hypothetical protein ACRDQF_08105 [Thermocrispum sp.]